MLLNYTPEEIVKNTRFTIVCFALLTHVFLIPDVLIGSPMFIYQVSVAVTSKR